MHRAALPPPAQLYDETLAARRVHGWDAVAPALTPYLNTKSWRSGAPLPDDLCSAVAARTRLPPWLPGPLQLLLTFIFTIVPGAVLCTFVYVISIATNNSPSGWDDDWPDDDWPGDEPGDSGEAVDRAWLFVMLLVCPFLLVTFLCFCVLRRNDSVRQHVGALYLLYLQDWAAASVTGGQKDLVLKFKLGRLKEYTVYSDGSYEVREAYRRRHATRGWGTAYNLTARGGGPAGPHLHDGGGHAHGGVGGHMHGGGPSGGVSFDSGTCGSAGGGCDGGGGGCDGGDGGCDGGSGGGDTGGSMC